MFNQQFLLAALFACALAAPVDESGAQITKFAANQDQENYGFELETENGIRQSEQGKAGKIVQGEYSYISPEGIPVSVVYVADENGFHPESNLLPTPPPIPEEILRSIQFIEQNPTPEELADRAVRAQQI